MNDFDAVDAAHQQLVPRLNRLCEMAKAETEPEVLSFFQQIATQIEVAQDETDLMGPFMELSTSAFRGFQLSFEIAALLDEVLDHSSRISEVLARDSEEVH
ncbi:MAG: hypothetical protein CL917_07420 [Deltaproteobacteria bacterium]|nr:hypothetical protein [Deltaproteobacteria bacterium]